MDLIDKKPRAGIRQLCGWAWRASKGERMSILWVAVLGLMRVAASLCFIWVSKMLIDAAVSREVSSVQLWTLSGVLAGCMLAELALSQAGTYVASLSSQRLANSLRSDIYRHFLSSDLYSARRHTGDVLNRVTVDVGSVVGTLTGTLPRLVVLTAQLVAAFWLLAAMSPTLALCAVVISPLSIVASKAYMHKMRRINESIRDTEGQIHANLQEGLQHRMVVQTLECAPLMTGRLDEMQESLMGRVVFRSRVSAFNRSTVRLGFIAGYLIAFIWSVFKLHTGAITFGVMTAFLQLVGRIQSPISSLSGTVPGLVATATAIDRLMEIYSGDMKEETGDMRDETGDMRDEKVGVKLCDVTFAYPGTKTKVFDGFSHDFTPGSRTVVMGETGVGKSTLTKLILALLHPRSGSIEAYTASGSCPVSASTRRYMTYVPQGNSLLCGTVRENLLLGNPEATEDMMREALHTAVADFVYQLPMGLDTPCGELGSSLSEGQCQRIAIARALLRDVPVMILDEFNSSLDTETAELLLDRLTESRGDNTIIFISHRSEVERKCTKSLFLNIC